MFDTVRNNSKIMMALLLLLVIPSFVLVGVEGYSRMNDKGASVAQVDGQHISQQEWDDAHKREIDRIRDQMPNVDVQRLDTPEARLATLERMLDARVLALSADKQMLFISDARLAQQLQQNPAVAAMRGPDGKIDRDRYRQFLAGQGLTPEGFNARMRQDMAAQQVVAPVQASALALDKPARAAWQAYLQRREVQVQTFATADLAAKLAPSDEQVQAHYAAHAERFRSTETVDVEYVVLDLNALMASAVVPESELRTYYEQNLQRLAGQEQRRASHILITADKAAPAAERDKARALAQSLLEQARKAPQTFAELARKHSQDTGSAVKGGDLEFFARGAMVKPFEDAAFALKDKEISDVVETEFGFHIIALTGIKAPKVPSFESLRPQLEGDLRKQQAQRTYAELADAFSNGVYEQADALKPVADKLKLSLKQARAVAASPAAGVPAALQHPKLLQALFAPDALTKRRNTEAIEVAPNTLVSARVVAHSPSVVRPLAEVRASVRQQWIQDKAQSLAKEQGAARVAQLQSSPSAPMTAPLLTVSRDKMQSLPKAVVEAALRTAPDALPAVTGVDLGAAGYAVVRVLRIAPRDEPSAKQSEQERQQYAQMWSQLEVQAYLAALRKNLDAKTTLPAPKSASLSEK